MLHDRLGGRERPISAPPGQSRSLAGELAEGVADRVISGLFRWNRGQVHGRLPGGSFVLVANHSGHFDWMMLDLLFRQGSGHDRLRFVANDKVLSTPILRTLARQRRAIVLEPGEELRVAAKMVRLLKRADDETWVLGVFPEGTRSRSGRQGPSMKGAALVARRAGVPVVPVALCGFWELWPPQRSVPTLRRVGLSVHVLEPLQPADFADDQSLVDEAMRRVYTIVDAARVDGDPRTPGPG